MSVGGTTSVGGIGRSVGGGGSSVGGTIAVASLVGCVSVGLVSFQLSVDVGAGIVAVPVASIKGVLVASLDVYKFTMESAPRLMR